MKTTLKKLVALSLTLLMCCSIINIVAAAEVAPGYRIQKQLADADSAFCARQGAEGQLKQEGGNSIWMSGSWVEYKLSIPVEGTYRIGIKVGSVESAVTMATVSVDGKVALEMEETVPVGLYHSQLEVVFGNIIFDEAGEHTIRILGTGGGAHYASYMYLEYLGSPIEISSVTAGETDLTSEGVLSAGCDYITAEFSKNISDELAGSLDGFVSLVNSKGENLKLFGDVNKKVLTIQLADSLIEGEEYTLNLINIPDDMDYSEVSEVSYSFVAEAGEGTASIDDMYAFVIDSKITAEAVMYSSQNIGIAGRNYSVYISYEDGEKSESPIAEGVSAEDGLINVEYDLPADSLDGTYNLYFVGDYAEEEVVSAVFVCKDTKETIAETLAGCETADEVEAVLTDETNAKYIGINPASEIGSLKKAQVYTHFLGKDIDFDNIASEFRKYIAVENFRQANTIIKLKKAVQSEENWNNMGIDKAKFDLIPVDQQTTVINDIKASSNISDADEYIGNLDLLINNKLMEILEKTDLTPAFEDISAYVNQGVEVPLAFEEEASEICFVLFTLTVSDEDLLNLAEITLDVDGEVVYEIEDNKIIGLILLDRPIAENELGTISLTVPDAAGTYTVELSGEVYYAPAEIGYTLYADINEASMEITASKKPSGGSSSTSKRPTGGSGGGGGSKPTVPSTPVVPDVPQQETFSFSDVPKGHWAYESVDYLLKNGILEKTADGKYNPDDKMAREEIVKMMVLALGLTDENAVSSLSDVTKSSPYYKYIASAEKYGIVMGNDLGQFMIGKAVTREDICVILHRAVEKVYSFKGSDDVFADDNIISDYAKTAVYDMKGAGIIEGIGENEFMPKGDVTRAQAAKMIYEIVKAVGR